MSEYQYYRFECLDGHLDSEQREELRRISSRADITTNSFQVYYHYSGLKAEPVDVVLNNFDIGFYYADWGCIDAYIKLPFGTIPDDLLQTCDRGFNIYETEEWQLLIFSLEEFDDYFDDVDTEAFFQHLALLRTEIMQGDWRLLYFMWLRALDYNDEVKSIPMIDFDFNKFSEAQSAFATLFNIPLGLVKALALALEETPNHRAKQTHFNTESWLGQLSENDKNQLLTTLFEQGQLSRSQALAMTRKEQTNAKPSYTYWLSAEVLEPYLSIAEQKLKQEQAAAQAKRLAAEKAAKEETLTKIYNDRDSIWQSAEEQAARACASGYEQASSALHQLAEAYQFKVDSSAFENRFMRFITKHHRRKALLKRLEDLVVVY